MLRTDLSGQTTLALHSVHHELDIINAFKLDTSIMASSLFLTGQEW